MKHIKLTISLLSTLFSIIGLYAQELYSENDALGNDSNTIGNWSFSSKINTTVVPSSDNVLGDAFALRFETTQTSAGFVRIQIPYLTQGVEYIATFRARNVVGDGNTFNWEGVTGASYNITFSGTNWVEGTVTFTPNNSVVGIKIYPGFYSDTGADVMEISSLSIQTAGGQPVDTTAPTTSLLNSTSITTNSVDLTWSGASDDTGVVGYKVFREGVLEATLGTINNYQVTNLSEATTYNFTVSSFDAANNESILSNVVTVTTNATTQGTEDDTTDNTNPPTNSIAGVWNESSGNLFYNDGNIGIGTDNPGTWKLAVNGNIRAKGVKVETGWADYVFEQGYNLPSLEEVRRHIEAKGHLINIPSATEVAANGIELGEMNKLLLEKIEELTLYILKQDQQLKTQQKLLENLKVLEQRLLKLESQKN